MDEKAFECLTAETDLSIVHTTDETISIVVEIAESYTVTATLNQAGWLMVFYSRTLNAHEQNTQKQKYAIVEALHN